MAFGPKNLTFFFFFFLLQVDSDAWIRMKVGNNKLEDYVVVLAVTVLNFSH